MHKMWLEGLILFSIPGFRARFDKLIVLSFGAIAFSAAFYAGGTAGGNFQILSGFWHAAKVQLIPFLILNYLIGMTVYIQHIHPDIEWKYSNAWSDRYGQIQGTTVYHVPPFLNFFIHGIFIHVPHHVYPSAAFYHSGRILNEIKRMFPGEVYESRHIIRDYFRSARFCKLIDDSTGKWIGYPGKNAEREAVSV